MTKILDIAQVGHPVLREPTMELSLDTLAQEETQLLKEPVSRSKKFLFFIFLI